jgi:hypothetical protein
MFRLLVAFIIISPFLASAQEKKIVRRIEEKQGVIFLYQDSTWSFESFPADKQIVKRVKLSSSEKEKQDETLIAEPYDIDTIAAFLEVDKNMLTRWNPDYADYVANYELGNLYKFKIPKAKYSKFIDFRLKYGGKKKIEMDRSYYNFDHNDAIPGNEVQVKGYYRRDGTYVRPHTRSRPHRR